MADFNIAYQLTSNVEGGYSNDPNDNGNWTGGEKGEGFLVGTNWGVTAPEYAVYLKRVPTVGDMKDIPKSTALKILKTNYWDSLNIDFINDQRMGNELYDTGINMGVRTAGKFLQRVLNVSIKTDLTVDGIVGSKTIGAFNSLNNSDKYMVWKLFNCLQGERYISICEANPTQERFLRSWASRVFES